MTRGLLLRPGRRGHHGPNSDRSHRSLPPARCSGPPLPGQLWDDCSVLRKEKNTSLKRQEAARSGPLGEEGRGFLPFKCKNLNHIPGRMQIRAEGQTCSGKSTVGKK